MAHDAFVLPNSIIGQADVSRLHRQLETLDEDLHQAALRKEALELTAGPQLQSVASANDIDLQTADGRRQLLASLQAVLKEAPVVTMSFAVDPSPAVMTKIVSWFRQSIDPVVLVRIGLQPNIAAGCMLRTPGRVYDFSLRSRFVEQRPALVERMRATQTKAAA